MASESKRSAWWSGLGRALVVLTLVGGLFLMSGCETWKGAGKDVQKTGESMQN